MSRIGLWKMIDKITVSSVRTSEIGNMAMPISAAGAAAEERDDVEDSVDRAKNIIRPIHIIRKPTMRSTQPTVLCSAASVLMASSRSPGTARYRRASSLT